MKIVYNIAPMALAVALFFFRLEAASQTYAERLGWEPGSRVVMFHL